LDQGWSFSGTRFANSVFTDAVTELAFLGSLASPSNFYAAMNDLIFSQACLRCKERPVKCRRFWNKLFSCKHCKVGFYAGPSIADAPPRMNPSNVKFKLIESRIARASHSRYRQWGSTLNENRSTWIEFIGGNVDCNGDSSVWQLVLREQIDAA